MLLKVATFLPKQVIILSDKKKQQANTGCFLESALAIKLSARICFMYKLGIVQRKETVVNSAGKPMNRQWLISLYKHVHILDKNTSDQYQYLGNCAPTPPLTQQ